MGKWLNQVRKTGKSPQRQLTKLSKAPSVGFVSEVGEEFTEKIARPGPVRRYYARDESADDQCTNTALVKVEI